MSKSKSTEAEPLAISAQPAISAILKSVDDWAGQKMPPSKLSGRPHPKLHLHAAAAALHGWAHHAYHAGEPMRLTETDYDAALKAASAPVAPSDRAMAGEPPLLPKYRPHPAALSPHHPRSASR